MVNILTGAIAGDIIGSVYEFNNYRAKDFPLFNDSAKFTDDTVMSIAVAGALQHNLNIAYTLKYYGRKYPNRGYGGMFYQWLASKESSPYNSYGNGAAMRASAAGILGKSVEEVLRLAEKSASATHNHPEGIKGAQATAVSIFMARTGESKSDIKSEIEKRFYYNLDFTCDAIRPTYQFNETCQETVPQAIIAFLESSDYEDAIRNAVSIGGDSDTIASITGGISAAFYNGVPDNIIRYTHSKLSAELLEVVLNFERLNF